MRLFYQTLYIVKTMAFSIAILILLGYWYLHMNKNLDYIYLKESAWRISIKNKLLHQTYEETFEELVKRRWLGDPAASFGLIYHPLTRNIHPKKDKKKTTTEYNKKILEIRWVETFKLFSIMLAFISNPLLDIYVETNKKNIYIYIFYIDKKK